jgi:ubiquinone/menaquinone biosynthesis C-methylase UbiE
MTGVRRLFDSVAQVYDTPIVQRLVYKPDQDVVVSSLAGLPLRRVIDVGSGTGILATRVAAELRPGFVCGCDFTEGMLAQAAARTRTVSWVQADALRLPCADGSFDALVSTEAFHFFDQRAALAEFFRVLSPGGRLVVSIVNPLTPLQSRVSSRVASETFGAPTTWPTRWEMRRRVEEAGFKVVEQRRVRRVLGHLIPTVVTVAVKPVVERRTRIGVADRP